MNTEPIRTNVASVSLTELGYFHIVYDPNTILTLEESKAVIEAENQLSPDKKRPLLLDGSKLKNVEPDARKYLAGGETAEVNACVALLVGSPVSRVLGNFFLKLDKPSYPMQLFTDQDKAIQWLKQYL